ncbi:MAG: hypothetical protein U5R31_01210 [Acidimicrobiia bacterium]|nr:hypothetical protein [Acidimicrobiia bacterium]
MTLAADDMEATFLPELGMLGASLTVRGQEFLSLHGGVNAFQEGHTTGIPLLHPWANRLDGRRYSVAGADVDLADLELPTDPRACRSTGTMLGEHPWEVARTDAGPAAATLRARFDYGAHSDLLRLPVPTRARHRGHRRRGALDQHDGPRDRRRRGARLVRLPPLFPPAASRRQSLKLSLPARQHLTLDARHPHRASARSTGRERTARRPELRRRLRPRQRPTALPRRRRQPTDGVLRRGLSVRPGLRSRR